ncbi:MAG TPA: lysophospholipid acyltransferase family protein [Polyangiaceae bacterium]|nr:lysophospholipid acyltransferase family protein [Polyangiaceae bacterium]
MTASHIAHAIWQTLRISAPTIWEGMRGTLTPAVCDARLAQWSSSIVQRARIDLHVSGVERAVAGESFVIMSNHQSLYDVPVVYQALQRRIRMVAKKELFKVPVWGRAMRRAGFISLDRQNRERSRETLEASADVLHTGTSIWIAPEGTRSKTGELGEFRKGGFHLALQSGCRILPLSIAGTRAVLPAKGGRVAEGCRVNVTIHEPIDAKAYGEARRDELIAAVRRAIAAGLARKPT